MAINFSSLFTDIGAVVKVVDRMLGEVYQLPAANLVATITGITKANPGVVTATAHGFSNGDVVTISGVAGMTQVNGVSYRVTVVNANSFQLTGVDSTAYGTYTSGGTAVRVVGIARPKTLLDELAATISASGGTRFVDGVATLRNDLRNAQVSNATNLVQLAQRVLFDQERVLAELDGVGPGATNEVFFREFYRALIDATETINRSTVTIGTVTADGGNIGNGTILLTKVLDGFSRPGNGMPAIPEYANVSSELAATSDTLTFTCVADRTITGEAGAEQFQVVGQVAETNPWSWRNVELGGGSEANVQLDTVQRLSVLTNGMMDSGTSTANVPNGWTLETGTAGTHVHVETSTNIHRGAGALRLTGDASLAEIKLSQSLANLRLNPLRGYVLVAYVQGTAGTSAGTLRIRLEGTGYSSSELIEMNAAALAAQTTYGLESTFLVLPANVPDDLKISIVWTGTPSAHSLRVDSVCLAPTIWAGGVGMAVVPGATAFRQGDRFSCALTNDDAGKIQRFFRKAWRVQLPSASSPTQADSKAY